MRCCEQEHETAFCPHCGKGLGSDHNLTALLKNVERVTAGHQTRVSQLEKELGSHLISELREDDDAVQDATYDVKLARTTLATAERTLEKWSFWEEELSVAMTKLNLHDGNRIDAT